MDPNSLRLLMGSAGAGVVGDKSYIEDVFSTWLYAGNGSTQTITNGIDLSGQGGLTWIKGRSGTTGNRFVDTVRGATKSLESNSTAVEATESTGLTAFSSTGFSLGADTDYNTSAATYTSWSFRKAAKFFDVVTFTISGTNSNRRISHSLGSAPGLIVVKSTTATANWPVYHSSLGRNAFLYLNNTIAASTIANFWGTSDPTSTDFGLNESQFGTGTFVAYIFADDAGGFGDSGSDNVISCGSYTGNGSTTGPVVTLGWEPQWLLIKRSAGGIGDWNLIDNTRGFTFAGADAELKPNANNAEASGTLVSPLPTGFQLNTTSVTYNDTGSTFVYIAIRRGPMKTPTDPTNVFSAVAFTGSNTANQVVDYGLTNDLHLFRARTTTFTPGYIVGSRFNGNGYTLTGNSQGFNSSTVIGIQYSLARTNTTVTYGSAPSVEQSQGTLIGYSFRRAPGFFDVVTYTGTGSARTLVHNLGVIPELILVKRRDATAGDWQVYAGAASEYLVLNTTAAKVTSNTDRWNNTAPTSSFFSLGTNAAVNANNGIYNAYLFATCPGVSKVGTYTGTGTTLNIDCGFTNGARFVLIKRTDSTGDWYVWDTARGIVAGNDPFLLANSTAAENTATDYIDPLSSGFQISSTAPAAINASGGTYLYLAIH